MDYKTKLSNLKNIFIIQLKKYLPDLEEVGLKYKFHLQAIIQNLQKKRENSFFLKLDIVL